MSWLKRVYATLFAGRAHNVFDEEMQFHLDQRTADYVRNGM